VRRGVFIKYHNYMIYDLVLILPFIIIIKTLWVM